MIVFKDKSWRLGLCYDFFSRKLDVKVSGYYTSKPVPKQDPLVSETFGGG
jgi:hypothetical protein